MVVSILVLVASCLAPLSQADVPGVSEVRSEENGGLLSLRVRAVAYGDRATLGLEVANLNSLAALQVLPSGIAQPLLARGRWGLAGRSDIELLPDPAKANAWFPIPTGLPAIRSPLSALVWARAPDSIEILHTTTVHLDDQEEIARALANAFVHGDDRVVNAARSRLLNRGLPAIRALVEELSGLAPCALYAGEPLHHPFSSHPPIRWPTLACVMYTIDSIVYELEYPYLMPTVYPDLEDAATLYRRWFQRYGEAGTLAELQRAPHPFHGTQTGWFGALMNPPGPPYPWDDGE